MYFQKRYPEWQFTSSAAFGTGSEIHVWMIPNKTEQQLVGMASLLSNDEQNKLTKLIDQSTRNKFLSHRVYRRQILSSYLNTTAEKIIFSTHAQGKPFIKEPETALKINSTHTQDQVLLAISNGPEIGIDIESDRVVKNWQAISKRVYPTALINQLMQSESPEQEFIASWTRFEAMQKCFGEGVFGKTADDPVEKLEMVCFELGENFQVSLAWQNWASCPGLHFYRYQD